MRSFKSCANLAASRRFERPAARWLVAIRRRRQTPSRHPSATLMSLSRVPLVVVQSTGGANRQLDMSPSWWPLTCPLERLNAVSAGRGHRLRPNERDRAPKLGPRGRRAPSTRQRQRTARDYERSQDEAPAGPRRRNRRRPSAASKAAFRVPGADPRSASHSAGGARRLSTIVCLDG